ncbi:hypothetical protein BU15DRAFT_80071 [Melanogaster broomeanus]|nr:hypothetical protein BU15DRAFT_80071 [Melanogaster broomeanus]
MEKGSTPGLVSQLKEKIRSLTSENRTLKTRLRTDQRRAEASRLQLVDDLEDARATHASCSTLRAALQDEVEILRRKDSEHNHGIQNLRAQFEILDKRFRKDAESSARILEENDKIREEVMKLRAENHKAVKALEQARKELQEELQRGTLYKGCIERYKRKCDLEKKKRKALENAHRRSPHKIEDEALVVVDANAPDEINGPDFRWLDEACEVKGDRLDVTDEENSEVEESEDELQLGSSRRDKGKQKAYGREVDVDVGDRERPLPHDRDEHAKPLARFSSDWSLGQGQVLAGPTSGVAKKRKQLGDNRAGGSKFFKVKTEAGARNVGPASSLERNLPVMVSNSKGYSPREAPFPIGHR